MGDDLLPQMTVTGYVDQEPWITESPETSTVSVRFRLVYSPTDHGHDDVMLPCLIPEARASAHDIAAFLVPETAIQVTGHFRLPGPGNPLLLFIVTDVDELAADEGPLSDSARIEDVHTYSGYTVARLTKSDETTWWSVTTPDGEWVGEANRYDQLPSLLHVFENEDGGGALDEYLP